MELQNSPPNTELSENKFTSLDVLALSAELGASLVSQRTYGKQGEDIKVLTKVFLEDLKAYEPVKVMQAIKQWRMISPEFPTPADINAILAPQPKFDKNVYYSLNERLKRGDKLSFGEMNYIRKYEQNITNTAL